MWTEQSAGQQPISGKAFDLYYDGFRSMTLGRTLWLIIGIKLFIMFAILKVFFFPNFLSKQAEKGQEADYVSSQFEQRAVGDVAHLNENDN